VTEPSPNVAHSARLLNHLLGGTDNHPVDRAAAEQMLRRLPGLKTWARCNRRFQGRAVRYLTGNATYVEGDLRDPARILRAAAATLDLSEPVAVMLVGVVDFIVDDHAAAAAVRDLMAGVPSGSYLVLTHPTLEVAPEAVVRAMEWWNASGSAPICARTPSEVAGFFRGLDLLDPGVVTATRWRPDGDDTSPVPEYAGVARKP
jgi:hypothetical protein